MKEIIDAIIEKHRYNGIVVKRPASIDAFSLFEQKLGFPLPKDFKHFYTICDGFECVEDIFNITSLAEIIECPDNYGTNWFYFAEYMIYCDMWGLRFNANGTYEIFNDSYPGVRLTSSIAVFLKSFLAGDVFEKGGSKYLITSCLQNSN